MQYQILGAMQVGRILEVFLYHTLGVVHSLAHRQHDKITNLTQTDKTRTRIMCAIVLVK